MMLMTIMMMALTLKKHTVGGRHRGPERLANLPKVSQLINDEAGL